MRAALLALMAIGTLSAIDVAPAQAREVYPFCMRNLYGGDDCTFSSFQQCMWSASGLGQDCFANPALAYGAPRNDLRPYGDEPAPRRGSRPRRDY